MCMSGSKSRSRAVARQRGFSMFELIVYLLVSSILFAAAFNRYQAFPGEAERANFTGVMAQLKAGLNLQMISAILDGSRARLRDLEGSNPMDFMLETPVNYIGVLSGVAESQLPRRVWYFDSARGELVYLVERAENLYAISDGQLVPSSSIRLRITNIYGDSATQQDWQGIVLAPSMPYEWRRVPLELYRELGPEAETGPLVDLGAFSLLSEL
jgi:type II secretory pathway pseudopilin PulG